MRRFAQAAVVATLGLLIGLAAVGQEGDMDRKTKILENLKLKFPQIREANLTMGEITPSQFAELDEGSFTLNGRQTQKFLVSKDDKALYLIAGDPIDVSLTPAEIEAEVAKQEAEQAKAAMEREEQIAKAIAGHPVRGNPDAPITIVEYSDFQCPYCSKAAETVEQVLEKYPNDVKFVFQHFPLNFHPWAKPAAIAADCAAKQDEKAFWTLHDKYFEHQKELNPGNVIDKSKEYLAGSGIDMDKWATCAADKESDEYKEMAAAVDAEMQTGSQFGVSGTPGFFINGQFLNGAQPLEAFQKIIESAKQEG